MPDCQIPTTTKHPPVLLCARVLGYTLIEAPTTAGRDRMVYTINRSSSDENLLALSNHYIQRLLRIFKSVKGRTLASSQHSSPPDVDDVPEFYQNLLQQASLNHCTAKKAIKIDELDGTGIHRLENILTLCSGLRDYFDKLALWLQAVNDQPNTYVVVSTSPGTLRRLPSRVVTFTTPNPQTLPLPSPEYLAIHAACCHIAHMSGAAEYVENVLREEEDLRERVERMGILAEDGSLMELFSHCMTAAIRVP
ncbi:uncharacterized protein EV420DRAFT_1622797 [Desarmillaria tabescens]|uniref:HNH nuclease domain-containing protein n=1 Tax=Armillaria tabescens TaxID=1929756 RepID=A0AA39JL79_ARMTA|nr:uncharacterized protein EV420DRAFT_1622797 [Desarmillaria tabescens]KAK0444267.1 hypothetical protein EV420DRAFT_1622797 [Desarmillaria tabescens]